MSLNYKEIISPEGLNSVTFSDPYAKLCFITTIVRGLISSQDFWQSRVRRRILYLDTDTAFTAYAMAGIVLKDHNASPEKKNEPHLSLANGAIAGNNTEYRKDLINEYVINNNHEIDKRIVQVFLPSEGRFESLLGDVIASMPKASIVIFDSLNSFYNMYPVTYSKSGRKKQQEIPEMEEKTDISFHSPRTTHPSLQKAQDRAESNKPQYTISRLNHLLSIFLMLLVKHGVCLKVPILVTSMVRYKKVSEDLWVKSPACRRLLQQKSVARLSVEMRNENDLSVNVLQHPSLPPQTVEFPSAGIYSAFEVDQRKS